MFGVGHLKTRGQWSSDLASFCLPYGSMWWVSFNATVYEAAAFSSFQNESACVSVTHGKQHQGMHSAYACHVLFHTNSGVLYTAQRCVLEITPHLYRGSFHIPLSLDFYVSYKHKCIHETEKNHPLTLCSFILRNVVRTANGFL